MQGSWKITYFYFTATTTTFTTVWFWQKTILTFTTFIFLLHPRLVLPSPCHDQDNSFFVSLLHSYIMIKRKIIWLLRSLCHDLRVKRYFFSLSHYVHYAMIKRKIFFFISALRSICHGYRRRNLTLIEPLLWLHYDYEKTFFFISPRHSMEISSYKHV